MLYVAFAVNSLIMVPFMKGKQIACVVEDNPNKTYLRVKKFRRASYSWTLPIKVDRASVIGPIEPGMPTLGELNTMVHLKQTQGKWFARRFEKLCNKFPRKVLAREKYKKNLQTNP